MRKSAYTEALHQPPLSFHESLESSCQPLCPDATGHAAGCKRRPGMRFLDCGGCESERVRTNLTCRHTHVRRPGAQVWQLLHVGPGHHKRTMLSWACKRWSKMLMRRLHAASAATPCTRPCTRTCGKAVACEHWALWQKLRLLMPASSVALVKAVTPLRSPSQGASLPMVAIPCHRPPQALWQSARMNCTCIWMAL